MATSKPNPTVVADERKPDPDEPWRYVCPSCRGQVCGNAASRTYHCQRCDEWLERDDLLDKKREGDYQQ